VKPLATPQSAVMLMTQTCVAVSEDELIDELSTQLKKVTQFMIDNCLKVND